MAEDDVSIPRDRLVLLCGAYMSALASTDAVTKDRALALTVHLLRMEDHVPADYKAVFAEVVRVASERLEGR